MKDINQFYFDILLEKSKNPESKDLTLRQPERDIDSNVIPLAIANEEDLESIQIVEYTSLQEGTSEKLSSFTYTLVKMQAGLGTSVQREDLIKTVENRESLGAKGTDLYFEINGKLCPIAEIQLQQAIALSQEQNFKNIKYINLVNDETQFAVDSIWEKSFKDKTYKEYFDNSSTLVNPQT